MHAGGTDGPAQVEPRFPGERREQRFTPVSRPLGTGLRVLLRVGPFRCQQGLGGGCLVPEYGIGAGRVHGCLGLDGRDVRTGVALPGCFRQAQRLLRTSQTRRLAARVSGC